MKKIFALILALVLAVSVPAACGNSGKKDADQTADSTEATPPEDGHPLYVRDENQHDSISATFKSTDSDDTVTYTMQKIDSGDGYTEFSTAEDTTKYDRVILTADSDSSIELAFNDFTSGWVLSARHPWPYTYGEEISEPKYERKSFDYDDRKKDVLIWTPADYDAKAEEKYSVIYMTDAQNLFKKDATATGSWAVAESALAMAKGGGDKCIIVGIENADGWRDDELTPNIGAVQSPDYEDGHGKYFSDFVVDTVMPYINENYNVYTDRAHTHISGSSSGGIETFYIAMEHPDKFASVGALSPAFLLFDDNTWVEHLSKKDYTKDAPFIYLYCGNSASDNLEQSLYTGTVAMPDTLKKLGYPEDKVVTKLYQDGIHNEMYWRAVFPDYLKYAFAK